MHRTRRSRSVWLTWLTGILEWSGRNVLVLPLPQTCLTTVTISLLLLLLTRIVFCDEHIFIFPQKHITVAYSRNVHRIFLVGLERVATHFHYANAKSWHLRGVIIAETTGKQGSFISFPYIVSGVCVKYMKQTNAGEWKIKNSNSVKCASSLMTKRR